MPADTPHPEALRHRRPPAAAAVRALSFHAGYGCRRTGACCTSNWPVPVESDRVERIRAALGDGRLAAGGRDEALVGAADAGGRPTTWLGRASGRCVFFEHEHSSCRIHSGLGHDALPLACRQFPRITVRDPRGVSLTLSHYCPTAAAMLERDAPVAILVDPPGFPAGGEYDGLDASTAMPPLLRPDMLMDWDAWWTFERLAVELLVSRPAPDALGRLRMVIERLRCWTPAEGPLTGRVGAAFEAARRAGDVEPFAPDRAELGRRLQEVADAAPPALARGHAGILDAADVVTEPGVASRFLAAHAFGNWAIQLGQGLRTWLRSVEAAHAALDAGLGVRHADLWLRHLADTKRLADSWSRTED